MKKVNILSLLAGLALATTSCMDLQREDFTEILPDNFFQTETDLKLACDALHYDFNAGLWGGDGVYTADLSGYQTISNMSADDMWTGWGWGNDELHFHQWDATNGSIQAQFRKMFSHYNYRSKARNTIRRIEASPVEQEVKNKYLGTAHAMRGWMALFLYDMFGPVPVAPDDVLDDPEAFVYLPRLTDEEYDKMMEDDLLTAIELLPEMPERRGDMAKGPARMILMKYYMIRSFWEKALGIARDLYAMEGKYVLQQDYSYVFSKEGIGNNEIILQLPCNISQTWTCNNIVAEVLPADMPWTEKSAGWGGYTMPWEFYDTFEPGDNRLQNVFESYVNTSGKTISRSDLKYGAIAIKYGKDPDMTDRCGIDVVVYRYSDVLLSLSELIVRTGGSVTSEALDLLNRVRHRAGLYNDITTTNVEEFMDAMLLERGHEFFLEGLRRQDLIRFGKYVEFANNRINMINTNEGRGYFNVNESHNRMPIPASFINESKSEIKQNPLY